MLVLVLFAVVTLLDYGAGNVRSVRNAIRHLGFDIKDVIFLVFSIWVFSFDGDRELANFSRSETHHDGCLKI